MSGPSQVRAVEVAQVKNMDAVPRAGVPTVQDYITNMEKLIDADFNLTHLKLRRRKAQVVPERPLLFQSLKDFNWKCEGRKPFQTVWIRFTEPGQALFKEPGVSVALLPVQAQKTPVRGVLSGGRPC